MNLKELIKASINEDVATDVNQEVQNSVYHEIVDSDCTFVDTLTQRQLNALGVFLYALYYDVPAEIGVDNPNIQFEPFTPEEVKSMIQEIMQDDDCVLDVISEFLSDPLDPETILDNIDYDIETGSYSEFDADEYLDNYNYACELAALSIGGTQVPEKDVNESVLNEGPAVIINAKTRAERRKRRVKGQAFLGQKKAAQTHTRVKTMAMVKAYRAKNKAQRIASGAFKKQKQYRTKFKAKLAKRAHNRNMLMKKGKWTVTHHKGFKK